MLAMGRPKKVERSPRRGVSYRLPEDLISALESVAEENRRPITTEVEIAIEKYLASHGLWPLKPESAKKK